LANLNRIILVGRLVADPEARLTVDGLPMTKFRLAVTRPMGTENGVDLIDIVAWRRLAEVCGEYLKKGQLVLVEGRIQNRSFDDQTGQRRWVTEVVAKNMTMLEKSTVASRQSPVASHLPPEENGHQATGDWTPETGDEAVDDSDLEGDLPF
jgi:single-strand DNA-binding protein